MLGGRTTGLASRRKTVRTSPRVQRVYFKGEGER